MNAFIVFFSTTGPKGAKSVFLHPYKNQIETHINLAFK